MENNYNETNTKQCHRCYYFRGYYTRGEHSFIRSDVGYCIRNKAIMSNKHTCDCWKSGKHRSGVNRQYALDYLCRMLENISGARQILEEAEKEIREDD